MMHPGPCLTNWCFCGFGSLQKVPHHTYLSFYQERGKGTSSLSQVQHKGEKPFPCSRDKHLIWGHDGMMSLPRAAVGAALTVMKR